MTDSDKAKLLDACQAAGPLELEAFDANGELVGHWSLPQPFAVIGRDPRADVQLADESVSKIHAYLQVIEGRVFGIDLGSRTGTRWNGSSRSRSWLHPGSQITLGCYQIVLRGPHAQELKSEQSHAWPDPTLEVPARLTAWPRAELWFAESGQRRVLKRPLTLVGRSQDCRIRVPSHIASRHHCAFVRTPRGLLALDLLSREGIRIDGSLQRAALFQDSGKLSIGPFECSMLITSPESENLLPVPVRTASRTLQRRSVPHRGVPADQTGNFQSVIEPMLSQFGSMQQEMINHFNQVQLQNFDQFQNVLLAVLQLVGTLQKEQIETIRQELVGIRELTNRLQSIEPSTAISPGRWIDHGHAETGNAPRDVSMPHQSRESSRIPSNPLRLNAGSEVSPPHAISDSPDMPQPSPPVDSSDIHHRLFERVEELQRERQSRWRKIIQTVTG